LRITGNLADAQDAAQERLHTTHSPIIHRLPPPSILFHPCMVSQ
jgi:hypothetical protein